ncbi:MAG: hypothetical protein NTV86_02385 [Planctomycetota bacterium]|nr:hypothetical protein [Planctomycetota bacterium]
MKLRLTLLILSILGVSAAFAQQADRPPEAPAPPPAPAAATQPASRPASADPTQAGEKLRPFLAAGPAGTARSLPPVPEVPRLPRILKRAYIQTDGGRPEAMIEVDGSSILSIREGVAVTASTGPGASFTFRVTRLTPDEIEIECVAPAKGQKLTIR